MRGRGEAWRVCKGGNVHGRSVQGGMCMEGVCKGRVHKKGVHGKRCIGGVSMERVHECWRGGA